MVQVLPYIPSFGEKLSEALVNATGNVVQGYRQRQTNRNDDNILKKLNDPNLSPIETATLVSRLSPDKQKGATDILGPVLKQKLENQQQQDLIKQAFPNGFGHEMQPNQSMEMPSQQNIGAPPQNLSPIEGLVNNATNTSPNIESEEVLSRMLLIPQLKPYAQDKLKQLRSRPRVSEAPVTPEQLKTIQDARNQPGFEDLDELGQYRALINSGVSPVLAEKESKLKSSQLNRHQSQLDKSYDAQKDFIDDVTNQYLAFETQMKPRLQQMQKLNSEELISPSAAAIMEGLGLPLGVLENPSNELYDKLSQDLLKGLPDTYGSRILKVEVDNFLKTIPRLINSADGRRMIASNMLKLGEIKETYYKDMRAMQRSYLDQNKPFPRDFQQVILDNAMPSLNRLNNEFVQLSDLTSIPKGTVPFFNPQGGISFVDDNPDAIEWASSNGGKRIW